MLEGHWEEITLTGSKVEVIFMLKLTEFIKQIGNISTFLSPSCHFFLKINTTVAVWQTQLFTL